MGKVFISFRQTNLHENDIVASVPTVNVDLVKKLLAKKTI